MGTVKIIRVVIDTNVVVSALLFGGTPGTLIQLWKKGVIRPFISKEIVEEYLRVFACPKFKLSQKEIDFLLYGEILPYSDIVKIKSGKVIVSKDPSDDKFIRCARAARAAVVISGDDHLLEMKSCGSIKILTPSEFFKEFIGS